MAEFELNGVKYQAGKVDVFKQDKIARRIMPVILSLPGALKSIEKDPLTAAQVLGDAIGKLSDEDVKLVQEICLSATSRLDQANHWVPIFSKGGGLMFEDIGLMEVYMIVVKVITENLGGFFSGLARKASEFGPKKGASSQ